MQNLLDKTQEICRIYGIQPARSKGQNFLINEDVYDRIIEASDLKNDDLVMEVGPGLGFLTAKLAEKSGRVIAVELDDKLAGYLKSAVNAQDVKNVEIINENVLDISINRHSLEKGKPEINKISDISTFLDPRLREDDGRSGDEKFKYKIVANLPYNITSVFIRKFLSEIENKPSMMVLMLQKEVAERITAKPGDMSLLAISVQFFADAEIIFSVPRTDFWPAPEVDSAVIRIKTSIPRPLSPSQEKGENTTPSPDSERGQGERAFFRMVKFGFTAKRKMLKNNLSAGYHITQAEAQEKIVKAGFNPKIRAQELSIEDWAKLFGEFDKIVV